MRLRCVVSDPLSTNPDVTRLKCMLPYHELQFEGKFMIVRKARVARVGIESSKSDIS